MPIYDTVADVAQQARAITTNLNDPDLTDEGFPALFSHLSDLKFVQGDLVRSLSGKAVAVITMLFDAIEFEYKTAADSALVNLSVNNTTIQTLTATQQWQAMVLDCKPWLFQRVNLVIDMTATKEKELLFKKIKFINHKFATKFTGVNQALCQFSVSELLDEAPPKIYPGRILNKLKRFTDKIYTIYFKFYKFSATKFMNNFVGLVKGHNELTKRVNDLEKRLQILEKNNY